MINAKEMSIRIAEARKQQNMTQTELARKLNMSPQNVSKWERGESLPDAVTLSAVADVLKKDISYFYGAADALSAPDGEATGSAQKKPRAVLNSSGGKWKRMDFGGAVMDNYDFKYARFDGCNFDGADFCGGKLPYAEFFGCTLRGADFAACELFRADFKGCDLSQATFARAALQRADFKDCVLKNVGFDGAQIDAAAFRACTVENVRFEKQDFKEAAFGKTAFVGCVFADCTFTDCEFKTATFKDCAADKVSYNFLLTCKANTDGITIG